MTNTIKASIIFSFKGDTFSPSVDIDLDDFIRQGRDLSSLYPILAAKGNIDTYSYAYEVMEMNDIIYSDASGLAVKHVNEGAFDYQSFCEDWLQQQNLKIVQKIAREHLGVDDIAQQPRLRDALLEALRTKEAVTASSE